MKKVIKTVRNAIQSGNISFGQIPNTVLDQMENIISQVGLDNVVKALVVLEAEFLEYDSSKPVGSGMAYEHQLRRQCWCEYHKELLVQLKRKC